MHLIKSNKQKTHSIDFKLIKSIANHKTLTNKLKTVKI
jgi:hypothetical protein